MQDDLRAELIKQFPSEVIETKDMTGKEYYACPTCKRAVAIEFDVPADFVLEDCRKCPMSYIGRNGDENVYECPLQMRGSCRLELS